MSLSFFVNVGEEISFPKISVRTVKRKKIRKNIGSAVLLLLQPNLKILDPLTGHDDVLLGIFLQFDL